MDEASMRLLNSLSRHNNTTISGLVRQAVRQTFGNTRKAVDPLEAIDASFGIWAKRDDIGPTKTYIRALRSGRRSRRHTI